MGVKQSFLPNDYALVLAEIRRENTAGEEAQLTDAQMALAVNCCKEISTNFQLVDNVPFVPDQNRKMSPASELVFNDAPWIVDPAILSKYTIVAPEISNELAEKIGCQSLRKLVVGGEQKRDTSVLTCPNSRTISARLGNFALDPGFTKFTPVMQYMLFDLLEIADSTGCTNVQFFYDTNSYPTQSLLHSTLSTFQGK